MQNLPSSAAVGGVIAGAAIGGPAGSRGWARVLLFITNMTVTMTARRAIRPTPMCSPYVSSNGLSFAVIVVLNRSIPSHRRRGRTSTNGQDSSVSSR